MGVPAPLGVSASGRSPYWPLDKANAVDQGVLTAVGPSKPFAMYGQFNIVVWPNILATLTTTAGSLAATLNSATGIAAGNAISSVNVPRGATVGVLSGTNVTLALPIITLWGKSKIDPSSGTPTGKIYNLASTIGLLGSVVAGPGIPTGTTVVSIEVAASDNTNPKTQGIVVLSAVPTTVNGLTTEDPFEFARNGNAITVSGADAAASFTSVAANFSGTFVVERSFDGGSTWIPANIGGAGTVASYNAGTPVSLVIGEPEREVLYRINVTAYTSGRINYRISSTGQVATTLGIQT